MTDSPPLLIPCPHHEGQHEPCWECYKTNPYGLALDIVLGVTVGITVALALLVAFR